MKPSRTIIIVVAIIAVLAAGFYFLLKMETTNEPEALPSFTPSPTINIFKAQKENIVAIKVSLEGTSYTVKKSNEKWVVNDDPTIKIKQSKADTLAYECSSVVVKQLVKDGATDLEPFGLTNPYAKVDITLSDGAQQTILIGAKTPDGNLRYIMLAGEDKVYAKSASGTDKIAPKLEKLRETLLYSVGEEEITGITLEKQGSHKIVLTREEQPSEEGEELAYLWKMKAPLMKEASAHNLYEYVLTSILELSFHSVAADTAQELAPYGLDVPYATYSVSDKENTYTVYVGKQTDSGRYVKLADDAAVYVVENSKLEFLNVGYLQIVDKLIHLEKIDGVSSVSVVGEGKRFEMLIEGSGKNAGYKINGTPVSENDFKKNYQSVLGIMLDDFVEAGVKPSGAPAATITYHKTDGNETIVSFYDWDERNYLAQVNGEGNLICRKKHVTNMLAKLQQTINE